MSYYTYMQKVVDEVIVQADNGLYYLEPSWRVLLYSADLTPDKVNDTELNWDGVKEYLELHVKKLNTIQDKIPAIVDWVYETITTVVEPAMLEEETTLIKTITEYMQEKNKTDSTKE